MAALLPLNTKNGNLKDEKQLTGSQKGPMRSFQGFEARRPPPERKRVR